MESSQLHDVCIDPPLRFISSGTFFTKRSVAYIHFHDNPGAFSCLEERGILVYIDASKLKNNEDTQAYVWWNAEARKMYVFFRGTDCKRDILANLDARTWRIKQHGVSVHRGFQEQFLAVKDNVTAFLEKHTGRFDHVVFCGHSLGGALATIASAHFAHILGHEIKVSCHTFGAPRVGNGAFSKHVNKLIAKEENWRVYHERDPVCLVPMSFRFCHVENTVLRIKHGSYQMERTRYDTPWMLRPLDMILRWQCIRPFGPHNMEKYMEKMENNKSQKID